MKINYIINEMLKKIEYSSICLERMRFKDLDKDN